MASKVVLIDDLDGSDASETVSFSLKGSAYEIDLSTANAAKLEEALAPSVGHGRKVGGATSPRRAASGGGRATAHTDKEQLAAIREWARARGIKVSDRGRISQSIVQQYNDDAGN